MPGGRREVRRAYLSLVFNPTHRADYGESSAAVATDARYMFVANDKDQILRLYNRYPAIPCETPVYALNVKPSLGTTSIDPETHIEAAVMLTDGNGTRIYWLGSPCWRGKRQPAQRLTW